MKDIELQAERKAFEAWWDKDEGIDNAGPWTPDSPIQFGWAAWRAAIEADRAQRVPDGILASTIEPRPLSYPLDDYHKAISEGPLHYTWKDKPHRLVYDLIAAVRYYASTPAPAQQERGPMTDAARDLLAERQRQISVEGWGPEHDDEHGQGEMAAAAACYALHTEPVGNVGDYLRFWPWGAKWWKPADSRRNLVKAGALILAEIERLDRATTE